MKKEFSLLTSLIMVISLFSGLEISVFATTSNTTITISNEFEEHMIGSSFGVSASYKSDTYSHNSETISYEISGPEEGLTLDGGMSCVGTKEDGIISIPFKATKIGTYIVTISSIDGATDSIEILVSEKTFNVYLASRLIDRKETVKNTNMLYHYIFDEPLDATDFMSSWVINDDFKANPEYYYETILLNLLLKQSASVDYIDYLNNNVKDISEKCISYSLDYFKDLDEAALKASKFSNMSAKDIGKLNESFEMSTGISNIWSGVSAFTDGVDTVEDYFNNLAKYAALRDVNHSYIDVLNLIYVYAVQDSEYNLNSALLAGACDKLIEIYSNKNVGVAECFENSTETIIWDLTKEVAIEALSLIFGEAAALIEITKDVSLIMANSIFGLEDSIKSSCLVKANNYIEKYIKQGLDGISASFKNDQEKYSEEYIACHELLISCFQYGNEVHTYYAALLYDKTPAGKIGTFINSNDKVIYEDMQRCFVKCDEMIADEYKYIESVIGEYKAYRYGNTTQWVITLNTNDEFGFETDVLVYDGDTIDLSSRIPKRNGYKFLGWYYDKECTIPLEENTAATTYLTLYANWEKEYIVVTDYDELTKTPFAEISYMPSPVTFSLSRNSSDQDSVVSIPAYIDGYEITKISDYGFAGCDKATSIYVPNTITHIGEYAFANDSSLIALIIPESVMKIGDEALLNCECDKMTIYGYVNSYAENYANSNQIKFVDINKLGTFSYTILDDGTAEISGYTGADKDIAIPAVIDGYIVSSIGVSAFIYDNFNTISLPITIKRIRDRGFYRCESLTSITIPDGAESIGVSAFEGCIKLGDINISNSVTCIGEKAFYQTEYYNNPNNWYDSVLYIGEYLIKAKETVDCNYIVKEETLVIADRAFYACTNLKKCIVGNNITNIGKAAFEGCSSLEEITLPFVGYSVTDTIASAYTHFGYIFGFEINSDDYHYYGHSPEHDYNERFKYNIPESLKSATITGGKILSGTFRKCETLTNIILPNDITHIESSAFYGCTNLESIVIPNSVTNIGTEAFNHCSNLQSVTLPCSVESSWSAFSCCYNVNKVVLTKGTGLMRDNYYSGYSWPWCDSEQFDVYVESGVTNIGGMTFVQGKSLCNIYLSDTVKTIGYQAFSGCSNLSEIDLCNVQSIESNAFYGCAKLKSIKIPDTIKEIGSGVFNDTLYYNDESNWEDGVLYIDNCLIEVKDFVNNKYVPNSKLKCIAKGAFSVFTYREWSILIGDFEYKPVGVSTFAILKYNGNTSNLIIPNQLLGYDVVSIKEYAFQNCAALKSVTIPDGITEIATHAFDNCLSLTEILVSTENAVFSSENGVLFNKDKTSLLRYPCAKTDKNYVIPNSVTTVDNGAFFDNDKLECLTISKNVKSIAPDYSSMWFSADEEYPGAFYNNTSLKKIIWNAERCYLVSEDEYYDPESPNYNPVYSLCILASFFPACTEFIIGEEVKYIPCLILANNQNIKSINISDNVTGLGVGAFYNCTNLTSVTIPDSLTEITSSAFYGCHNLKDVYFAGTSDDWTNITFDGDSGLPDDVYIHYNTSLPHYDLGTVTKEATCTTDGEITYICPCGYIKTEIISAFGHDEEVIKTVNPTCTENGYTEYRCNTCGETYYADWVYSEGHTKGDVVESVNPSCTQDGYTKYSCSVCGVTFTTDWVWAQGHTKGEIVSIVDPTCEESGYTIYSCSVCSLTFKSDWIYSSGHTQGTVIEVVEATCTEDGYTKYQCSSCNEEFIDNWTYAIGHSGEAINSVNATCIEKGYTEFLCDSCGETYNSDFTSPLGHAFENDFCVNCSKAKEDCIESSHNYDNNCDETWIISKPDADYITITFSSATETESGWDYIFIYDMYDNLIGQFTGTELASQIITVPGNIVKIRLTSDGCVNKYGFAIESIEICYADSMGIIEGLKYCVNSSDEIVINGYEGGLTELVIPSIIEGKKVAGIKGYAFNDCTDITSVTIPDSIEDIGYNAFAGCDNVTELNISNVSGVVSRTFINNIENSLNFDNITSLTLEDGITEIEQYAFVDMPNLKYVEIPESVESIGERAFGFYTDYGYDEYGYSYYYVENFKLGVYSNTAGENYAKTFGFDYELLDNETQLEGNIYYQNKNDNTMMRFIAEVDIEDVTNANSGEITVFYNEEVLQVKSITGAYKSLYAGGQVITAPEGKCFIISNQYTGFMYDDMMSVEFTLDNYDLGLSRDVIIE